MTTEIYNVSEAVLDSVVSNINDGKCQHVTKVPEQYRKETNISALHIASAVATEKVINNHIEQTYSRRFSGTGIFHLHPTALAVMKNCSKFFEIVNCFLQGDELVNSKAKVSQMYLYATKSKTDLSNVTLQKVYLLELAVMKNNVQLIKIMLSFTGAIPAELSQALNYAISNDLTDVLTVLVEYTQSIASSGEIVNVLYCSEVVIVIDRPDILENVIKAIPAKQVQGTLKHWLLDTCCILKRKSCLKILSKYDHSIVEERTNVDAQRYIKLLETFYDDCKDEVIVALKEIKDNPKQGVKLSQGWPELQHYLNPNKSMIDIRIMSIMFDLDLVDVDSVDEHGKSTLTHFLDNGRNYFMTYKNFVAVLKALIHENPVIEDETTLDLALKIDTIIFQSNFRWCKFENDMEGHYEMDQKIHSVFDGGSVVDATFVCPFLIYSGFKAKGDILQNAIGDGNIHPEELGYFQKHLDEFRPLILRSRDVLRKHFVGRKLHRFLESQSLPQRIKDFILIKT